MKEQLVGIRERARERIEQAGDSNALERLRIHYLGKKGEITQLLRGLGKLSPDERPVVGKLANDVKEEIQGLLEKRREELRRQEREVRLGEEKIDVTLPGRRPRLGKLNILTQVLEEIEDIFLGMGFSIAEGPEVENDYYNFEALNIPKDHPARDMWDTMYLDGGLLLRTHTSPVQVRTMEKMKPPVRMICPGKCYRYEAVDVTHLFMLNHIEGLAVDEGITFADLKGVVTEFTRQMFGRKRKMRFRPSYYPFVEPGADVDMDCMVCGGKGCRVCKYSGWIEIAGSGMVHPRVLENVGYDSERYTGFAFGVGLERVAMLRYGIDNIRLFVDNDLRFIEQF